MRRAGREAPPASRPVAPARPDLAAVVGPTRVVAPLLAAAALITATAVSVADLELSTSVGSALIALVVVVAVALARRSLAGVAVGAALRLARPYADGERVRIWLPALDADVQAEVVHIGVANTSLRTTMGEVLVPNTLLVQASPHPAAAATAATSTAATATSASPLDGATGSG